MNCHDLRNCLSLYLYGELDFASEEQLEQHLCGCSLCQRALANEKAWHTTLNAEKRDVPLDLLAQCRQDLRSSLASETRVPSAGGWWQRWLAGLDFSSRRWSWQIAAGSFLLFVGFAMARWVDRNGLPAGLDTNAVTMGMLGSSARIRDVQPGEEGKVRIVLERVREAEVTGSAADENVRRLLVTAMRQCPDPGIRVYSVEMLNAQSGDDVRDALVNSVLHDPNAAVRLKALEGLRRFSADASSHSALTYVLQHDDNAGVRSQAIEILAPRDSRLALSPELTGTLESVVRSASDDEYVRARCLQVLREMHAPMDVY